MLPLTQPTGLVRVKQRNNIYEAGIPIATRQKKFTPNLYLEWQIAYDTEKISESRQQIIFTRHKINDDSKMQKATYELTDLLFEAIQIGLLPKDIIADLISFGSSIRDNEYIVFSIQPSMEGNGTFALHKFQFFVCYERRPILLYQYGNNLIELVIKPKQRAVGSQVMLFFDIPVTELEEWKELQDRTANKNEQVTWTLNKNNSNVLVYIAKCFMLGSKQHNSDLLSIWEAMQKKLEEK